MGKNLRTTSNRRTLSGTIDKGAMARRSARKHAQQPSGTKIVADKRRKPPRHVKPLENEY